MTDYYYSADQELPIGTIIKKFSFPDPFMGMVTTWPLMMKQRGINAIQSAYTSYRQYFGESYMDSTLIEVVFEYVRQKGFPSHAKRFNCTCLCENLEDARKFSETYTTVKRPYIYSASIHSGTPLRKDMVLITEGILPTNSFDRELTAMQERARRYWRGEFTDEPFVEILVDGEVVVDSFVTRMAT